MAILIKRSQVRILVRSVDSLASLRILVITKGGAAMKTNESDWWYVSKVSGSSGISTLSDGPFTLKRARIVARNLSRRECNAGVVLRVDHSTGDLVDKKYLQGKVVR